MGSCAKVRSSRQSAHLQSQFGNLRTGELHGDFTSAVADDQFAATMRGWQHNRECAEHAPGLFRIAMRKKEAAFLIDQELVKVGGHIHSRAPQSGGDRRHDLLKGLLPGLAADAHTCRRQLPRLADRCVGDRFSTAAVRRAGRDEGTGNESTPTPSTSTRGIGVSSEPWTKKSPARRTPASNCSSSVRS
jgi:hypothetical protein